MRKEIILHLLSLVLFFLFVSFFKGYLNLSGLIFLLGGLIGTILPDLDHLIYIYFLAPQELTSQRVGFSLSKREVFKAVELLYDTRRERSGMIFHTAYFQIIALVLSIFVLTSSSSLLGKGIVLGLSLHLLIDQLVDFTEIGSLSSWFKGNSFFGEEFWDKNKTIIYWSILFIVLIFLGLVYS